MANSFKDSGLGDIMLNRDITTPNSFKDSGLGSIMIGRGDDAPPTSAGNSFKDSGLGSIMIGREGDESRPASREDAHPNAFVVRRLNEELGTELRLVTFSKIAGRELLKILDDVFRKLAPNTQFPEFDHEGEQEQNGRMVNNLQILNYQPNNPNTFMEEFTKCDKALIHSILHWVLGRFPESKERFYLSQYLVPVPVPEDLRASDDGVREVSEQMAQLTTEFRETHWNIRKMKQTADTNQMTKDAQGLETEKEQLKGALAEAQKKLSKLPASEKLLKNCTALREEIQRSRVSKNSVIEQQAHLGTSDSKLKEAEERLQQVKRDFGDLTIEKMIEGMRDEISLNRELLKDKMPKDISDYQEKVANLTSVLGERLDTDQLHSSVQQTERKIRELEEKHTPEMSEDDRENLSLYKKQVSMVTNRVVQMETELKKLQEQKLKVQNALKAKEKEMSGFRGSNVPRGQEFQKYASSLRMKSQRYKQNRTELQELQGELGVLRRTEQVLQLQDEDTTRVLEEMERARGVTGHRDLQGQMAQMAADKSKADQDKHQTLEELSKVVQTFVSNIRERRNHLAPQILNLRNTRQKALQVEQEWQQKREVYNTNKGELDSELSNLQSEATRYKDDCRTNESFAHRLHCQIKIAEVNSKRAQDEKDFRAGTRKLNERHKSYSELLDTHLRQLENVSKDLRERKTEIEGSHEDNLMQMQWFKNLNRLLDVKLQCSKRADRTEQLAGVDMGALAGGVDRLVL